MNEHRGLILMILVGSGAVLFLTGLGLLALRGQALIGGALMAAGVGDLIAAAIIRQRRS